MSEACACVCCSCRDDSFGPNSHENDVPLLGVYNMPRGGPTRFYADHHNTHNSGWGSDYRPNGGGYGREAEPADDGLVIRRSLPIRSDF